MTFGSHRFPFHSTQDRAWLRWYKCIFMKKGTFLPAVLYISGTECYECIMSSYSFLLFLICLGLGFAAIFIANHLHKKYALSYLSALNYYVIAAVVYGFFNWLGPVLVLQMLAGQVMSQRSWNIPVLLSLMAFPVLIIKIYFLIELSVAIRDRNVAAVFKFCYTLISLLIFLLYIFSVKRYFDTRSETWMFGVVKTTGILTVIVQFTALWSMYHFSRFVGDEKKRQAQKTFGAVFLASFSLYALAYYFLVFSHMAWAVQTVPILYFLVPLPPLLYLKNFLAKYYLEHPLLPVTLNEFNRFCANHHLSGREQEIIGLLLKGATKNEMAETLFLSPHTVRNHLANVYKKLGVKNKVQLFFLVRNFFGSDNSQTMP